MFFFIWHALTIVCQIFTFWNENPVFFVHFSIYFFIFYTEANYNGRFVNKVQFRIIFVINTPESRFLISNQIPIFFIVKIDFFWWNKKVLICQIFLISFILIRQSDSFFSCQMPWIRSNNYFSMFMVFVILSSSGISTQVYPHRSIHTGLRAALVINVNWRYSLN